MLSRSGLSRTLTLLTAITIATLGLSAPAGAERTPVLAERAAAAAKAAPKSAPKDPRRASALFVDPLMPAAEQGGAYRQRIGKKAQALWVLPEAHPIREVRAQVRAYAERARDAKKAPTVVLYGIPGRDCGAHSSANTLTTPAQYRRWVAEVAKGLSKQKAIVVVEPDALPLFDSPATTCATKPAGWQGMLRFAAKRLSRTGAWVYLDAGHSGWFPYDTRAAALKRSGIGYARGFSTNVSNFRPTEAEKTYATVLLRGLRTLGVKGKRYVVDTSRNGAAPSADGNDVINPTWARLGKPPRLVFKGAFDGSLWLKHPGESDGQINGGPRAGQWCDLLADRLLGRADSGQGC